MSNTASAWVVERREGSREVGGIFDSFVTLKRQPETVEDRNHSDI